MSKQTYICGSDGTYELKQVPLEELKPGYVRVQPKALAMNPVDAKILKWNAAPGSAAGCDFAGVVSEVGPGVSSVKVGDNVAGGVPGNDIDRPLVGAFTTAILIPADSLYKFGKLKSDTREAIPAGPVESYEQAASLGIGIGTSIVATEYWGKIPFKKNSVNGFALVYGAAGSLGYYTCQVYKYMGYEVIAVASAKHKPIFDDIGVKHLVDYHDKDWPQKVRKITGDDLQLAYDTIVQGDTTKQIYEALSTSKPATIHLSIPTERDNAPQARDGVTINAPLWYQLWCPERTIGGWVTKTSDEFYMDAKRPAIFDEINKLIPSVRSLPIHVVGTGLEKVQDGVDLVYSGVSGKKVVVSLP